MTPGRDSSYSRRVAEALRVQNARSGPAPRKTTTPAMMSTAVIAMTDGSRAAKTPTSPSFPMTAIAAAWHQ